jgi:type I restriction-modification system DNA methylase subunit
MPVGADSGSGYADFIWSVADLLRGDYKQSEYGRVILPFTLLRRLDCVLDSASNLSLATVVNDPGTTENKLQEYIESLGDDLQSVFEGLDLLQEVERLRRSGLLEIVVSRFLDLDLGRDQLTDVEMGHLFEELIRRFADLSNEAAGEFFTPRDVVRLAVGLLVDAEADEGIPQPGAPVSVFDPTCGTGGMLGAAEETIRERTNDVQVELFGQELNEQTWAICRADMTLKGYDPANILLGDSLIGDGHAGIDFDYLIANPPFGLSWSQVHDVVESEHEELGYSGRFGAGLPRQSDSSLLFLQHILSKTKTPEQGGSRVAIVLNGSPMHNGGAGSGESEIRRWVIENDWLDAVVALPGQLLFNTGIPIYIWLLSNRKPENRRGTVQLVDARDSFTRLRQSIGSKRNQITADEADDIVRRVRDQDRNGSRVLPTTEFVDQESGGCRIDAWMFMADVSPETHRPLTELVEVVGRLPLAEPTPLLRSEDLIAGGDSAAELAESADTSRRYAACGAGDIVGNGERWHVLPADFGMACTRLEVLKPATTVQENAFLLSLWLASPECRLQQTGSFGSRLNRETMVPLELVTDSALAAAVDDLIRDRNESLRLIDALFPDPFDIGSLQNLVPSTLRTEASMARAVKSLLHPLTDVVQRAELQYPYQIAKLARDYRLAARSGRQLEAGLLLAEAVVRSAGIVAAAALADAGPEVRDSVLSRFSGGISTGEWLSILQEAQAAGSLSAYPELAGLSFRKKGVGALLQVSVEIRNRVTHTTGMMTGAEQADVLAQLEPVLFEVLDRSTWLSQYEFLQVRSCVFTGARHEVVANRLNGSHPDWEPVVVPVNEPVAPNFLYLDTPDTSSLLSLHPFASATTCETCRRDEFYVLDRVREGGAGESRSLRDHRIEVETGT